MGRKLGYVPALDGVRALAIALVVIHHATGFPAGGWLGVDLFFVLSGFLITTLLLERRGRESISAFYRRRAVRLVPALLVLLLVSLAVDHSILGVVVGAGYFMNIVLATDQQALIPQSLHHLWSLAEEEQFYVVWPIVLYSALRVGTRLALALAACGIAASFLLAVSLFAFSGASGRRLLFAPDTRSVSILVGCALALGLTLCSLELRRLEIPALALAVGLVVTMEPTFLGASGPPTLLFALASAVLVVRALRSGSVVARLLATAPLVFLGRISYSLYLWHFAIFTWLGMLGGGASVGRITVGLALALGAACASYYLVEQPCLRRLRPAGAGVGRDRRAHRPLPSVRRPAVNV